ncbi:TolB family protein [Gloeobacter kilaueensis]|uniref:TolB family protein n=1 Tax=Gloeobacter kilaueensis TaxID=1416614 RepID=UPI0016512312|nr:PD40 domain-containing protein [Gloeobacter kilaueensis]
MKRFAFLLLSLILVRVGNSPFSVAAQTAGTWTPSDPSSVVSQTKPDQRFFNLAQLYLSRYLGEAVWSPDGRSVAFITNISGRENLWTVGIAGGWPQQLTVSDQRQTSPAWSPDRNFIVYASDRDGDEVFDLFLYSISTGQAINLTATPGISEETAIWSPDGRTIAYNVKPKTSSTYEIDLMDVSSAGGLSQSGSL